MKPATSKAVFSASSCASEYSATSASVVASSRPASVSAACELVCRDEAHLALEPGCPTSCSTASESPWLSLDVDRERADQPADHDRPDQRRAERRRRAAARCTAGRRPRCGPRSPTADCTTLPSCEAISPMPTPSSAIASRNGTVVDLWLDRRQQQLRTATTQHAEARADDRARREPRAASRDPDAR